MAKNLTKTEDQRLILNAYRTLLRACKPIIKKESLKEIRRAFQFAMDAHGNERRKSGEPYIIHPLEVATICAREIGLGAKSIISALLHDVVEDTPVTLEEIEEKFGPKIAEIIDGLTKVSGIMGKSSSAQAENFKKILLTLSDDVRVILVKLADRLHNMRTLDALQHQKQLKIASETTFLFAPLAHRLGLHAIKSELEDLALKYTEPEVYQEILQKLESSRSQRSRLIRRFISPIDERLKDLGINYTVKGRLKSIFSIYQKMKKQGIPFEKVFDVFAIRIIIKTSQSHELEKSDCWRAYSVVTDIYTPNPSRLRDWISTPKFNGYESLHTTVMGPIGRWFEVQIRTERMDEVAEKGFAAHWKYKEGDSGQSGVGLEEWLTRIRELLENPESEALEFLDDFKLNLFSEEIFAFTPRGDLKTLPNGATALDFAFEIHSDVGAKCIGAKVNQKIVPLSYKLKNGDQVEIITARNQKPNEGWLAFVVTAKAKSKIKSSLKEEKRKIASQGKEYLKLKVGNKKSELDNYMLPKLTKYFNCKSTIELYYQIGIEKIDKKTLGKAIKEVDAQRNQLAQPAKRKRSDPSKTESKKDTKSDVLLVGNNDIGMEFQFAKCCNPIPGDNIFGFITSQEGIKIHRVNCSNGPSLMARYGYRILRAKWDIPEIEDDNLHAVGVKIIGIDSPGIVSSVSQVISQELKVNMRSISFKAVDGAYEGSIILEMHDTTHLESLIKKLENISGVEGVKRYEVDEDLERSM
ncbi:MAG: bifunctional (p)ppGpp synthetase/guanosine-3',5'-bis(diphosphate) 3'-pyrophosphohydrolase [Bacteroidia bacterium]